MTQIDNKYYENQEVQLKKKEDNNNNIQLKTDDEKNIFETAKQNNSNFFENKVVSKPGDLEIKPETENKFPKDAQIEAIDDELDEIDGCFYNDMTGKVKDLPLNIKNNEIKSINPDDIKISDKTDIKTAKNGYKDLVGRNLSLDEKNERITFPEKDDNISFKDLTGKLSNTAATGQKDNLNFLGDLISGFIDRIDGESKDGRIDNTKQHSTGDCWLLSGINALNATPTGRKMIRDALDYRDGFTMVHLEGYGDVRIDDADVAKTKISSQYSSGDDDMIIFELAIEKVLTELAEGDAMIDPDSHWFLENGEDIRNDINEHNQALWAGHESELIYLLTGKVGENTSDKDKMKQKLEEFNNDFNRDIALGASMHEDKTVKDINGKDINLSGPHAYAISEIKDGVVTFTNPWDSGKEIQMDIDSFVDAFGSISSVDLSKDNPKQDLISRSWKYDDDGNKIFQFFGDNDYKEVDENGTVLVREKTTELSNGKVTARTNYDKDGNKTSFETNEYDKNGKATYSSNTEYDESGNKKSTTQTYYDKNGNVKNSERFEYNEQGQQVSETLYDKDGKVTQKTVYSYDKNGNRTEAKIYDGNGKLIETKHFDPKNGKEI